jgi:signal transduction histidine kinase
MAGFLDYFLRRESPSSKAEQPPAGTPATATRTPLGDDAFLAFISHELRTPLNAIIGYSEILQEDAVFLDQKDLVPDLRKIQKASEHLIALVDDIVDLSKIDAGRMDLTIEEFKPAGLVREVVQDTRTLVDRTFCTLDVEVADDLESMRGDRIKVQRGLSNLVRHVVGLAHQGRMTLVAKAEVVDSKRLIRFSLSHSELRARDVRGLLETRTGANSLPQYHGSGLGLVITDRFCRLMGGDFRVEPDASGEGVILTMIIPAEPAAP